MAVTIRLVRRRVSSTPKSTAKVAAYISRLTCSQFANFINLEAVLHVISRKRLLEADQEHGNLFEPLDHWYRAVKRASWRSIEDVHQMFPSADAVGKHTVFNIKANRYRLIVEINYLANRLYIRHVLTHAE